MLSNFTDFLLNTPVWDWRIILILIGTGAFVGFINTVAGLATAISYSLFMFMGMPINIANATTRVGVLAQFSVTSAIFRKEGYLDLGLATKVGIPVGLGAFFGAELAAHLPAGHMEVVMGLMLPLMGVLLLIDKKKIADRYGLNATASMSVWKYLAFCIVGIYGGFTHAGVGLLIMFGSFLMLGMDLLHANAIKQFAVVIYTPVALAVFILNHQINWPVALIYAVGNIIGGVLGSKAAIKTGERLIKWSVAIVVVVMSIWLLYKNFA